jgi:hypothetical protein
MPEFIAANVGLEINKTNIFRLTGYRYREIISFTGADVRDQETFQSVEFEGQYPILKVSIHTDEFMMNRRFNFELGTVNNQFFVIEEEFCGQGIGTTIFYNQVNALRDAGFIRIRTDAYRDGYNGYYTWARLGYSMINEDIERFEQLMHDYGLSYTSLNDLASDNGDKYFWREHGFTFEGEFLLDPNSVNSRTLDAYVNLS